MRAPSLLSPLVPKCIEVIVSLRSGAAASDGMIHTAFIHEFSHASIWTRFRIVFRGLWRGLASSFMAGAAAPGITESPTRAPFQNIAGVIVRRLNVPVVAKSADHFGLLGHCTGTGGNRARLKSQ